MNIFRVNPRLAFLAWVSLLLMTSGFPVTVHSTENPLPENHTIVLTTIFPPSMPFFAKLSVTYTEAFRRMGYGFKLISQPGERAMIDADQGIVDGEAGRRVPGIMWWPGMLSASDNLYQVIAAPSHRGYRAEHGDGR